MDTTNAVELLEADHTRVRQALEELATGGGSTRQRQDLLLLIAREVEAHTVVEEDIFYRAYRRAVKGQPEERRFFEFMEKHEIAETVLGKLLEDDPDSLEFAARVHVLREVLEGHMEEEERMLFPRARELFSEAELSAFGAEFLERKKELASGALEGDEDLGEDDEDWDEDLDDDEDLDEGEDDEDLDQDDEDLDQDEDDEDLDKGEQEQRGKQQPKRGQNERAERKHS